MNYQLLLNCNKVHRAAKGRLLVMMPAAAVDCGSGGSDDCGSDEDYCINVETTTINNQSNDDDDDDAEINHIVMLQQDSVPGGADYMEGELGGDSETCDIT
jgi:hypothetical protein